MPDTQTAPFCPLTSYIGAGRAVVLARGEGQRAEVCAGAEGQLHWGMHSVPEQGRHRQRLRLLRARELSSTARAQAALPVRAGHAPHGPARGAPQRVPVQPAGLAGSHRSALTLTCILPPPVPAVPRSGCGAGCADGMPCPCSELCVGAALPTPEAQLRSCVGSLQEKHQISGQCGNLANKPQSDAGLDCCSPAGCRACPAAAAGDVWLGGGSPAQTRACERACSPQGSKCNLLRLHFGAGSVVPYQLN